MSEKLVLILRTICFVSFKKFMRSYFMSFLIPVQNCCISVMGILDRNENILEDLMVKGPPTFMVIFMHTLRLQ